jgi:hypothetical protein
MHRPELSRKPLVGEKGALRAIACIPVEGEPDYYRMEESEHDGSYGVRLWTIRMPTRLELSLVGPRQHDVQALFNRIPYHSTG